MPPYQALLASVAAKSPHPRSSRCGDSDAQRLLIEVQIAHPHKYAINPQLKHRSVPQFTCWLTALSAPGDRHGPRRSRVMQRLT